MNFGRRIYWAIPAAVIVIGGCGESMTSGESMGGTMAGMQSASDDAVHSAKGTINSIDLQAGTINISHDPVPSAGWPSMTMGFRLADPASAEGLSEGRAIDFSFTLEGGGTVTEIQAAH